MESNRIQRRNSSLGATARRLPPEISGGSILGELERILRSRSFSHAQRLSRFLRYVVERTVRGEAEQIKEYLLGLDVFDKDQTFDPRLDPIVRVEAARLRSKLKLYYRGEGTQDSLLIDLPKGSYAPVFRRRLVTPANAVATRLPTSFNSVERTIAVLPFVNLSSEKDQDFFCEGLTEELINALTKIADLRVVACRAAQLRRSHFSDIRRIGQQLNVGAVLQGSVRRTDGRLRIVAHVVRIVDGSYIWSESFDREMTDTSTVQEEISKAVACVLQLELLGGGVRTLVRRYTRNVEAYNLYLKGRYHMNKRTDQSLKKGICYFQQAIELDPKYAPAYAGLSDSHALLGWYGYIPSRQAMPDAEAAALQALELDSHLAEAHMSLALVHELYYWRWGEAEREFRLATELHPASAAALFEYGLLLGRRGRLDEAIVYIAHALELEPLSAVVTTNLGVLYYYKRQYAEALELYLQALELDKAYWPLYYRLGLVYLQTGKISDARNSFKLAHNLSGDRPLILGLLAYSHGVAGSRRQATAFLNSLEALSKERYVPQVCIAIAAMGVRDRASVFEHLERALDERDVLAVDLKIDPLYDTLRSEPQFTALLERMGL